MNAIELSVIIINYNTFALTNKCIETIYQFTKGVEFEIILVDNASAECDADLFKKNFPDITLIKSTTNLGFSGGNNLGLQKAVGEYILLLNSDIELTENSIKTCLDTLKADKALGVVSPMLIYPDGKIQHIANKFPSVKYEIVEILRLHKFILRTDYLLGYFFNHKENKKVDWLWGAFFLTKREIIYKFPDHKLPDKYFMYFEDVAWCYGIKKMGYSIQYIASTKAIHHLSASSKTDPSEILNLKKLGQINTNETDFWICEKGKAYTALLFLLRSVKYLTLRTKKDLMLAKLYFKNIFTILGYKK